MRGRRSGWRSRGECEGIRWRGACAGASSAPARAVSGLRPGTLRSPARSWLTEACSALSGTADALARKAEPAPDLEGQPDRPRKARPDAVRKTPQQSVERRAGLRYWPVISERSRRSTPTARRVRGAALPHQRLSAFCSPHFFRGAEKDKGDPAPSPNGRRSVGCLTIEPDDRSAMGHDARTAHSSFPSTREAGRGSPTKSAGRGVAQQGKTLSRLRFAQPLSRFAGEGKESDPTAPRSATPSIPCRPGFSAAAS